MGRVLGMWAARAGTWWEGLSDLWLDERGQPSLRLPPATVSPLPPSQASTSPLEGKRHEGSGPIRLLPHGSQGPGTSWGSLGKLCGVDGIQGMSRLTPRGPHENYHVASTLHSPSSPAAERRTASRPSPALWFEHTARSTPCPCTILEDGVLQCSL